MKPVQESGGFPGRYRRRLRQLAGIAEEPVSIRQLAASQFPGHEIVHAYGLFPKPHRHLRVAMPEMIDPDRGIRKDLHLRSPGRMRGPALKPFSFPAKAISRLTAASRTSGFQAQPDQGGFLGDAGGLGALSAGCHRY
jgi:hypothetical protein